MYFKLRNVIQTHPTPKPRKLRPIVQPVQVASQDVESDPDKYIPKGDSNDKSVFIGADPFNRKSDAGAAERIQGKIQLLRELQKELGKSG